MSRIGRVERVTKESQVQVEINLDGSGISSIATGVPFFDHMLDQLAKHGNFDLTVKTEGDLVIDSHHTVEDTSIAIGQAFKKAMGDKVGISRFADAMVPLDEACAQVVVDVSGRPYLVHDEPNLVELIGSYDTSLTRHIFESFVANAEVALHVRVISGRNAHHIVEAQFKAFARALRSAVAIDPKITGVPSTKGVLGG